MSRFRPFAVYICVKNIQNRRIMRKIINKTKLALAFLAMLWQVFTVSAQPTIYEHPVMLTSNPSLVREYAGTDLVVYHYPYFAYIEDNNPFSKVITHNHLPSTIRVCDMEIFNGVLYFCGLDNGVNPSLGIFGYVSVSDLADSTVSANIYCQHIPYFAGLTVTSALKMEVFKSVANDYHIVMVGDCDLSGGQSTRCLMDAFSNSPYTNPSQWIFEVAYEPMLVEYFTDVAVTDNYVVTDAQKYGSGAEYMRFFDKPFSIGSNIFGVSTLYHDIYMPDNSTYKYQSHYIAALPGDEVATSTIAQSQLNMDDGVLLTHIDCATQSVMSQSFLSTGTNYDTKWGIKDITHDRNTNNLYILARVDINSGGLYDYIIDIPSFPPIMSPLPPSYNAYTTFSPLHSLAPLTSYPLNVMAVGDDSGRPRLYQHLLGTTSSNFCDNEKKLYPDTLPLYMTEFPVDLRFDNSKQYIYPLPYSFINTTMLNIICY